MEQVHIAPTSNKLAGHRTVGSYRNYGERLYVEGRLDAMRREQEVGGRGVEVVVVVGGGGVVCQAASARWPGWDGHRPGLPSCSACSPGLAISAHSPQQPASGIQQHAVCSA